MNVAQLANGMHLIVVDDDQLTESAAIQLHLQGAGGYYDPPDARGLAVFATMLVTLATGTRSAAQIREEMEAEGIALWMKSTSASTAIQLFANAPLVAVERAIRLAADVVRNPIWPEDELDQEREQNRAYLAQVRASPAYVADAAIGRAIYGAHPAAHARSSPSDLDAFTRERVAAFARERYIPDHAVLVVGGSVGVAAVRAIAEDAFGDWPARGTPLPPVTGPDEPKAGLILVDADIEPQVRVGTTVVNRTSQDFESLEVLTALLSSPVSGEGRLTNAVREHGGGTDRQAVCGLAPQKFGGAWIAKTTAGTESAGRALSAMLAEIGRLREDLAPDAEIATAKEAVLAAYVELERVPQTRLLSHVAQWMYRLPGDYRATRRERIMDVSVASVRAAAEKYLNPNRLPAIIAGPRVAVEPWLERAVSPVAIWNQEAV